MCTHSLSYQVQPTEALLQRKGLIESAQSTVDKETDAKLRAVQKSFAKNRDPVVRKLLDRVVLVKPELHRNLTKLPSQ